MVAPVENPQTLMQATRHFTPDAAERYVEAVRWPGGACCPKCGSVNVGRIKTRRRFQCREKGCRKQFSVMTGTIFEDTHLTLDKWMVCIWMLCSCRNGISSYELARTLGCAQLSAWHLAHRVRHVLQQAHTDMLGRDGVECDWTYVGGLARFMSLRRQMALRKKKNWGKTIVHAIKDRKTGTVRARVLPSAKRVWIHAEIRRNVERESRLYTDAANVYRSTRDEYQHRFVDHFVEYVKDECHTNGCENYFNCLRRAVKGTYIRPTPEHMQPYVDESVWRFDNRELTDWERFQAAMKLIVGKRLTYSSLTDGAKR